MFETQLQSKLEMELLHKLMELQFSVLINIECIENPLEELFLSIWKEASNHVPQDFHLEQGLRLEVSTVHEYLLHFLLLFSQILVVIA